MEKLWISISFVFSGLLAYYTDLHLALALFGIATVLDILTAIHAGAIKKRLSFNPLHSCFWLHITSDGLRKWCRKVFWEYGIYLIIAFAVDSLVLKNFVIFNAFERKLTLPVIAVYLFSFIEIWSIGENIEKAGGINIFKRFISFFPKKYQDFFNALKK